MSQDKGPPKSGNSSYSGSSSSPGSRSPSGGQRPPNSYQGSSSAPRSPSGYQGSGAPRPAGGGYQGANSGGYTPRPPGSAPRPAGAPGSRPASGGGYQPRPAGAGGASSTYAPRPAFPRPASRDPRDMPNKDKDSTRTNQDIRAAEVRLVGADGEMVGVVSIKEALAQAEEAGLDLVEVSPNAEPPVCKILDYGKFKYAEQKKKAEARKKQKVVEIKEIKLRPAIDVHDLEIKLAAARRFLTEGDKVKVTMRFRGREMSNLRIGDELLDRVKNELENLAKMEQRSGLEGRQMVMILGPIKT